MTQGGRKVKNNKETTKGVNDRRSNGRKDGQITFGGV